MACPKCEHSKILQGLAKVVILDRTGFEGVEFWHYDEFKIYWAPERDPAMFSAAN